ncbi:flagellar assembly protein FliO [Chania multitudinisentens RB-25]|uniref:Flagellar protein n=1 Tax=Chania multitudinisentens RB-25 TaxID=1441930 RepID=W0LI82_9GAMM|nr:flagellar biosynthetic protein FliO [Chania multitudinisentens]AHG22057.1 flagellar assembly protein FliO [Chania multitudinisentens RB-25]
MNANAAVQTQSTQQQPTTVLPAGSVLMQVGSALSVILLLILCVSWLYRRLGFASQTHGNKLLQLKASCPVGQRERVVIVEVDNTWLVLGVTAQQITPLHTLPAPEKAPAQAENLPPADFRRLMQKVLKRPEKSA